MRNLKGCREKLASNKPKKRETERERERERKRVREGIK